MSAHAVPPLLQHVRRLAAAAAPDEQLLADFLARRSDEAFAALLGRHGPMVLNVCRRILHDAHAAEDVFQATFLVLADRAAAVRQRASLAGFLHGVAYRLAVRAKRRRTQSLTADVSDHAIEPAEGLAWKEMLGILDRELGQLSDRYRAPLVLCYLEGRTQDEAARQLGWSLNTLRRRLARGRQLLEARLRGRGVTLSAGLAGLLAAGAAVVPGRLQAATLAAVGARAGGALTAGASALSSARKGIALWLSASGKKVAALFAVAALAAAVCFWKAENGETRDESPPAASSRPSPSDSPLSPLRSPPLSLGTVRYRLGAKIATLAVSADGRLAVASSWSGAFTPARAFDLTDGRCLYTLTREGRRDIEAVGLSPDGKTLAARDDAYLYFRDAATGKELRKLKYLPASGGGRSVTSWLTFTPDGKQVAATLMGNDVHLVDVATGKVTRTFAHAAGTCACVFSPDGKLMAGGGFEAQQQAGKYVYFARLWEVTTGKELRRFTFAQEINRNILALAFSPDGTMLAGGCWEDGRLRLFEVATGKELHAFPKIGYQVRSVAFAPDGKTVAAAGDHIHLYDPVTGKERLQIKRRAQGLAFSRDGSVLTGAVSGAIYRWDAASGRQLTPAAAQDSAVAQILVSPDGRSACTTDQDGNLYLWDAAGRKSPRRIAGEVADGVVASPDGRLLAWVEAGGSVRLYDTAAGRVRDRIPGFKAACVVAFLPGGKTLLTFGGDPPTIRLCDVETGKERRSFVVGPKWKELNRGLAVPYFSTRQVALAPDGKTLAIGPDWTDSQLFHREQRGVYVRLWDVTTGKPSPKLDAPRKTGAVPDEAGLGTTEFSYSTTRARMKATDGRAFSPDGRFFADWAENPNGPSRMDHVNVWDVATGRAVATLHAGPRAGAANAAFAPDGRTLAVASADGTVRLWETATWRIRAEFRGHRDRVTAVAFGPDGRLFTGGLDTVVLGWDVRPQSAVKGSLADAWAALAQSDAAEGFQAQGRFLAEPGQAVEWFKVRLAPAVRPDPSRVQALVADLGREDFATRARATAGLKELWPATEAALREVVAKSPTLEARRRAEGLIREMERAGTPPGKLRALRAAEALEWVATPQARAVLHELAKGDPGDRLTIEAIAACGRLDGRK